MAGCSWRRSCALDSLSAGIGLNRSCDASIGRAPQRRGSSTGLASSHSCHRDDRGICGDHCSDPAGNRGITEKNRKHLTFLYRSITGSFSVEEAATALSFTTTRTQRFLAYLADRGWLVRVCRGLYAPIPLDAISPSEWREDPWVIAVKLFGPDYYIGGWTACEHWSFTEQIFMDTVVVTTRKMRSKRIQSPGLPLHSQARP